MTQYASFVKQVPLTDPLGSSVVQVSTKNIQVLGQAVITSPEQVVTPVMTYKHRKARTGAMVNHPFAIELRSITAKIDLLGEELVNALYDFNGTEMTRAMLQAYLQGYVRSTKPYEDLLGVLRLFLAHRERLYGNLMNNDARTIIEGWLKALRIPLDGSKGAPFRLFSEAIGPVVRPPKLMPHEKQGLVEAPPKKIPKPIDPTTVFRWHQKNKKPETITLLIWLDGLVKQAAKKERK
jgi:hypothetical protein